MFSFFIGWEDGLVTEWYVKGRNYGLSGYCEYRIKRHDIQDIIYFFSASMPCSYELSLDCSVSLANAVFIVIFMMIVLFVFFLVFSVFFLAFSVFFLIVIIFIRF